MAIDAAGFPILREAAKYVREQQIYTPIQYEKIRVGT
jgi:hypothetical protein